MADASRHGPAQDPLASIDWPQAPTIETLGVAIGAMCGLKIVVEHIPSKMRHPEISGLTVVVGTTAHIYYDGGASPLNQMQTVLHEYAHLLHGDVRTSLDATHARTTFDSPVEQRAETTGMRLMDTMLRKHHASDLLDFFAGDGGAEHV
ncbi:hypothetical protein C8K30_1011033 [Promicromonospora sp. AC04]|uniref:hypothetical protein n=1 Tax=Promicromonospora sp. AC04 TaxID=2135723 RepID=UPI000D333AAE|nr:hypothetical protein [Promicromonospora sp. AC04]PUB32507.1 hypothetical protein C8K30_1011033 [Promicromonospora sp. AC04]